MNENEIKAFDYEYAAYTTQELIDEASKLPIHQFADEIPSGKILEVGYQMGGVVLYYASKGRSVHALDMEPYYQGKLQERLKKESYRNLVSFSLSRLPAGKLPNEKFAIVSICNLLHFFDFGTAQFILGRLTELLIPGGWIFTQNHHKNHLYSNNDKIVGPECEYKHFFSKEEIGRLFPKSAFIQKHLEVRDHFPNEKERNIAEYYWSFFPAFSKELLKEKFIDIDYHRDIFTVHQKLVDKNI